MIIVIRRLAVVELRYYQDVGDICFIQELACSWRTLIYERMI